MDYIFRWLDVTFPNGRATVRMAEPETKDENEAALAVVPEAGEKRVDSQFDHFMADAPACDLCGAITVRNGACYRCYNCGNSMGCS